MLYVGMLALTGVVGVTLLVAVNAMAMMGGGHGGYDRRFHAGDGGEYRGYRSTSLHVGLGWNDDRRVTDNAGYYHHDDTQGSHHDQEIRYFHDTVPHSTAPRRVDVRVRESDEWATGHHGQYQH